VAPQLSKRKRATAERQSILLRQEVITVRFRNRESFWRGGESSDFRPGGREGGELSDAEKQEIEEEKERRRGN
jgi:hypothetical protein